MGPSAPNVCGLHARDHLLLGPIFLLKSVVQRLALLALQQRWERNSNKPQ